MFPWNNQFPYNEQIKDFLENGYPKGIESYVQGVLEKSMQPFTSGFPFNTDPQNPIFSSTTNRNKITETQNKSIQYHVFETHDDVYIQIPIHDKGVLENIKIYHTANKSMVEGIPTKIDKHEIILPAIVKKKGAQAIYKDDLLQIRIPKNIDFQFTEIDVQEK